MTDYLEELLEAWAEDEGGTRWSGWEKTPAVPPAGGKIPQSALLTAPVARGPRGTEGIGPHIRAAGKTEGGEVGRVREDVLYEESDRKNPPVSFTDSPLRKGAKSGAVEALRSRLRRGSAAAAYRKATPQAASAPTPFLTRERTGQDVAELDAAVRRDARRYDGEMTLY